MIFEKENLGHQIYFVTMFEDLLKRLSFNQVHRVFTKSFRGKKKVKGRTFFIDVHVPYNPKKRLFDGTVCMDHILVAFNSEYGHPNIKMDMVVAEYRIYLFDQSMDTIFEKLERILYKESDLQKKTRVVRCIGCNKDMLSFEKAEDAICRGCF